MLPNDIAQARIDLAAWRKNPIWRFRSMKLRDKLSRASNRTTD